MLSRRDILKASAALGLGGFVQSANAAGAGGLVPGTRYAFFSGGSSVPAASNEIVPDGHGGWVGVTSGQGYDIRETHPYAGGGLTAIDVIAAGPQGALFSYTAALLMQEAGTQTQLIDAGGIGVGPKGAPEFWLPPDMLAGLRDGTEGKITVTHIPYSVSGADFAAVRICTDTGGGWNQDTYDLATGLLIACGSTVIGGNVLMRGPFGDTQAAPGSTMITTAILQSVRKTDLPGPGLRFPDAVMRLKTVSFSGQASVTMPGGGVQMQPTPIAIRFDIEGIQPLYGQAKRTITSALGTRSDERIVLPGTVGSLWMDPAYLASLRPGQPIDSDSTCNVTLSCGQPADRLVTIVAQSPLASTAAGYDAATGLMTVIDAMQMSGPAQLRQTLRLDHAG